MIYVKCETDVINEKCLELISENKENNAILLDYVRSDKIRQLKLWLAKESNTITKFHDMKLLDCDTPPDSTTHFSKCIDMNIMKYFISDLNSPVTLAASFGSVKIFQFLSATASEDKMKNVITAIVLGSYLSFISPAQESQMFSHLERLQTKKKLDLRNLLLESTWNLLRPLELSILLGCNNLIRLIINVKHVYVVNEKDCGPMVYKTYDFREYSSLCPNSRFYLHPLKLFSMVTFQNISSLQNSKVLNEPIIMALLNKMKHRSIIFVIYNILNTLLSSMIYLYLLAPSHYKSIYALVLRNFNETGPNFSVPGSLANFCGEVLDTNKYPKAFINWAKTLDIVENRPTAIINGIFLGKYLIDILLEFVAFNRNKNYNSSLMKLNNTIGEKKERVMKLYFCLNIKVGILVMFFLLVTLFSVQNDELTYWFYWRLQIFDVLCIIVAGFLIFDFLYQISIFPWIGPVIQRLLRSFSIFLGMSLMYFGTLAVFAALFYNLMPCLNFDHYAKQSSVTSSWIVVFHLNLNVIDFPKNEFERLWLLQVLVVLILPFFVLNFIITVINEEVNTVSQYNDIYQRLYAITYYHYLDTYYYFPPIQFLITKIFRLKPLKIQVISKRRK